MDNILRYRKLGNWSKIIFISYLILIISTVIMIPLMIITLLTAVGAFFTGAFYGGDYATDFAQIVSSGEFLSSAVGMMIIVLIFALVVLVVAIIVFVGMWNLAGVNQKLMMNAVLMTLLFAWAILGSLFVMPFVRSIFDNEIYATIIFSMMSYLLGLFEVYFLTHGMSEAGGEVNPALRKNWLVVWRLDLIVYIIMIIATLLMPVENMGTISGLCYLVGIIMSLVVLIMMLVYYSKTAKCCKLYIQGMYQNGNGAYPGDNYNAQNQQYYNNSYQAGNQYSGQSQNYTATNQPGNYNAPDQQYYNNSYPSGNQYTGQSQNYTATNRTGYYNAPNQQYYNNTTYTQNAQPQNKADSYSAGQQTDSGSETSVSEEKTSQDINGNSNQ